MLTRFIILAVLSLSVAGCGPLTTPVTDGTKPNPSPIVQEHAPAAEIWIALAHAVETHQIETPFALGQFVQALSQSGDLSESDLASFNAAFPGAPTDQRALDVKADSAKLRGIK